jgi:thioesterase domain-containing protein
LIVGIPQADADHEASLLVELRRGTDTAPLFLFSGGDGSPHGLSPLARRMHDVRPVIGVDFCRPDTRGQLLPTVELMAAHSCSAIRTRQPQGPYYLVGYSFGGLIALEVARSLRNSGEEVALLGLIDTLFDQHCWPTPIFLRSQARLIRRHLAIILNLPLNEMIRTLFVRSHRLLYRFARRQMPSSLTVLPPKVQATSAIEQHCKEAMGRFCPAYYAGKIVCIDAENHDDYGCNPAELWRPMVAEIACVTVSGTHVGILDNDASLTELAATLDANLHRAAGLSDRLPGNSGTVRTVA